MAGQHSRPRWHYSPQHMWMNDPNGLIYNAGTWHMFYQSNPTGNVWGNLSWGHATSSDLLHWTEHQVALWHTDTEQIFSGSCVFDADNSSGLGTTDWPPLVAVYTAAYLPGSELEGRQAQALAYSLDGGSHWTTYPGNPVLDRASTDFRDPKVFRHGADWVMVAVEAEQRQVVIYRSANLIDWTHTSTFGPTHAAAGVWECPDLFELPVANESGRSKWVLLVNINPGGVAGGSGCQYFVGDFDGFTFTPDSIVGVSMDPALGLDDPLLRAYDWLDFGRDCYAVTSFADVPDGRRIVLGWMNNWDYANDVPLTGGRSIMTIPRELDVMKVGDRYLLRQRPIGELPDAALQRHTLTEGDRLSVRGVALEYHNGVLSLDRRGVGQEFHEGFGSRQWAEIPERPASVTVDILLDTCSIEVFAASGLVVISDLVFF